MIWMTMVANANPGAFAGTWVHAGDAAEKAKIEEVIEGGAQRFNFAIRPIARSKIRKACALDASIAITGESGSVSMTYTGDNPRVGGGPSDGTKVDVNGSMVGYRVDGTTLTVDGKNEDGGKLSVYKITGDSTMEVTHRLSSSSLGDPPLVWTVHYRRK